MDLMEPNKAVIVDNCPFPHTNRLLSALKGSTVFTTINLTNADY